MKCLAKNFVVVCIFIFVGTAKAYNEELLKQSIIYGISYLASGNLTMCTKQLKMLFEGIEVKKAWALKGLNIFFFNIYCLEFTLDLIIYIFCLIGFIKSFIFQFYNCSICQVILICAK